MRLDPLQTPLGKLKLWRSLTSYFNLGSRMGGPREYIFGGTTQLKPHFKSGLRLWVVVYLDHHVHVFLKKAILPRRNKHYFEMYRNRWYIAGASSEIQLVVLQRSYAKTPEIWSKSISGKFLDPLGENIDFRFNYTPKCMVSSLNFQNLSGEGLTEPPPQSPSPAQSQASPSILGHFAPSVPAAPSIRPSNMFNNPSPNRGVLNQTLFSHTPTSWLHHWTQYIVPRLRSWINIEIYQW